MLYSSGIVRCFNSLTYSVRERCTNIHYRAQGASSYPNSLQTLECQMEAHWHTKRLNLDKQLLTVDGELSDNVHVFFPQFTALQKRKETTSIQPTYFHFKCVTLEAATNQVTLHTLSTCSSPRFGCYFTKQTWRTSNSECYNQTYPP